MRILIVLVCIVAIGATAATIIIGGRSFEGLVVEKPYDVGLAWDKTRQQKVELGWNVSTSKSSFAVGANDLRISVSDKTGKQLANAELNVKISRPATTAYDRTYQANRQTDGSYLASITLPLQGNWEATITVACGNSKASYSTKIYAPGGAHETHTP